MFPQSRSNQRIRRFLTPRRTCAVSAALWLALTAMSPPTTGIEGLGTPVSDAALSDMRGKFISPDGISYFGLQLQTSWQGQDGITTYATVLFNVDFAHGAASGSGTPHLLIGWSRDCDACGDAAMDVPGFGPSAQNGYVAIVSNGAGNAPVGGLQSVQGAVQNQQIAGSDNRVLNDMRILVVPADQVHSMTPSGLTEIAASASKSFNDGDKVDFILGSNQVALALSSGEGRDFVLQSVDGAEKQAAQHVVLNSDLNAIRNAVAITVGVDQLKQLDMPQVSNALPAMKGRGF